MAERPGRRPASVDAIGATSIADPTTDRAVSEVRELVGRMQQAAVTPTVNRVTLNRLRPRTTVNLSLFSDPDTGDLYWRTVDGQYVQLTDGPDIAVTVTPSSASPLTTIWFSPLFESGNASVTRGPNTGDARATYMGKAPQALSSINVLYILTSSGTMTWGEWAIATGTFTTMSTSTLTIRGYVDSTANWTSGAGVYKQTIPVTGADIAAGTDIWVIYAAAFTAGAPTLRVSNLADQFDSRAMQIRVGCRPSANLNTPLAFAADLAGVAAPWVAFSLT